MKPTKQNNPDGSTTAYFPLDDIIEALEKHGVKNDGSKDELIKELLFQKIEYARLAAIQVITKAPIPSPRVYKMELANLNKELKAKIIEYGGTPAQYHPIDNES